MRTSYVVTLTYNVESHATVESEDTKRGLDLLIVEAGGAKYHDSVEDLDGGDVVHTFEYPRLTTSDSALVRLRKVTRNREYCSAYVSRDKVSQ